MHSARAVTAGVLLAFLVVFAADGYHPDSGNVVPTLGTVIIVLVFIGLLLGVRLTDSLAKMAGRANREKEDDDDDSKE